MAATARKLQIVHPDMTKRIFKNGKLVEDPKSGNHQIRKIAKILLNDHPEGLKLLTLRKICETRMGKILYTPYIITSLMNYDFYIDCKHQIVFKA